jgi:hypothetical protein
MSVATHSAKWSHRLNGEDPASPIGDNQGTWTSTVAGAIDNDFWKVSATGYNKIDTTDLTQTMILSLKYDTIPVDGTLLASLDNGTGEILVKSTGVATSLKLEATGATAVTISDLDLTNTFIFRITLNTHAGNFYPFDLDEDESGNVISSSITSTGTAGNKVSFGCDDGIVLFGNIYYTSDGAFSTTEMAASIWTSDFLIRTGYRIIELLKASKRMYLKSFVEDASIVYANDLSPTTTSRLHPPTIFVQVPGLSSSIESLGGGAVNHDYEVEVFVVTKSADFRYAHRLCAEISGEVVEEIYTSAGQNDNKDSVIDFRSSIDMKVDEDEVICVNQHSFKFRRRVNYRNR